MTRVAAVLTNRLDVAQVVHVLALCCSSNNAEGNCQQESKLPRFQFNPRCTWLAESSDDFVNRMTVVDFQPLSAWDFQTPSIEAQLLHHGRVDVGDVVSILDGVEAEFISGSVDGSAFDPAAGHPDRKAKVVMVAVTLNTIF